MRRWFYLFIFILIISLFLGCGSDVGHPVTPGDAGVPACRDGTGFNAISGCRQVAINETTGETTVMPLRTANLSLNAVSMLQSSVPAGLEFNPNSVVVNPLEHTASVEVRLRHPMPTIGGLFTAFDVRGIVFGPKLTNADGFTAHLNPNDFTGVPFGYVDGLFGTPDWAANYHARYAGYKYFCDGLGPNDELPVFLRTAAGQANRGSFPEGTQHRRRYDLDWEESDHGYLIFNYAVVGSYSLPIPGASAPFEIDDFGLGTANCAESFSFEGEVSMSTVFYWNEIGGGSFMPEVELWDWQGLGDTELRIEPADGESFTPETLTEFTPGTTAYSGIFTFDNIPVVPLSDEDITLILTATDFSETFGGAWFGNLLPQTNWRYDDYVYTVYEMPLPVMSEPPCLPALLNETFDNPVGWNTGPGSFWNFNTFTPSAADNRSVAICYGFSEGVTVTWCESPWLYVHEDCYDLPLKLKINHHIDMETYYDRCWVELKNGCEEWVKLEPYCGLLYCLGEWWDGYHEDDFSLFELEGVKGGDSIRIRFVTHTLDGNANCVQDGYHGWQIYDALITD